ncbi:MAG: hypothetical protein CG444_250, partial [Methanosaeta sp. ASP1-2]
TRDPLPKSICHARYDQAAIAMSNENKVAQLLGFDN